MVRLEIRGILDQELIEPGQEPRTSDEVLVARPLAAVVESVPGRPHLGR